MSDLPAVAQIAVITLIVCQIGLQVYGVSAWLRLYRGRTNKDYVSLLVIVVGQLLGALLGILVLLPQRRAELDASITKTPAHDPDAVTTLLEHWPQSNDTTSVTFSDVSKTFGETRALDGVTVEIGAHGAVGLLGPNGAGKTTLIKILLGLVHPDSGRLTIAGETLTPSARRHIGYCPDVPAFESWMTGLEVLVAEGCLLGLDKREAHERAHTLLGIVGLTDARGRVGGWSRGMRQRIALARALVGYPTILVLDEPTSALDPAGRADILALIHALANKIAIIFSTHRIEDVDRVCDHIIMVDRGRVIASATRAEFARRTAADIDVVIKVPNHGQRAELEAFCRQHGLHFEEHASSESLEQLFLELTGAR